MEIERLVDLIILIILLFFSAFFSGSEVALFGLDKKKINHYFPEGSIIQRYLNNLLSSPRRLLISILIGNNLVNVAISIISVILVSEIALVYQFDLNLMIGLQIIFISSLILIFGEFLPKMIATNYQIKLVKFITIPMYYFTVIIYPISEIISEIIRFATSKIEFDRRKLAIDSEQLSDIALLSDGKINLNQSEKEMLESISDFKDISVSEIMTPRVDIIALSVDDNIEKAIDVVTKSGHSRIPVYEKSIDNIVGILYAKDLLKFNINPKLKTGTKLKSLLKRPLYVPETKKIDVLLNEFQSKKNHIAIVVDEYGGTAGLITIEDIIEEILGDIWDEFDRSELSIISLSDKVFDVNANLTFSEFESKTKLKFEIDEKIKDQSFAVYILENFGEIPQEKMSFELAVMRISILEVAKKRIKKIRIELLNG